LFVADGVTKNFLTIQCWFIVELGIFLVCYHVIFTVYASDASTNTPHNLVREILFLSFQFILALARTFHQIRMTDLMFTVKLKSFCHQIAISAIKWKQTGLGPHPGLQFPENADEPESMGHFDVALVIVDRNKYRDGDGFDHDGWFFLNYYKISRS
jgi:hypothetical protein